MKMIAKSIRQTITSNMGGTVNNININIYTDDDKNETCNKRCRRELNRVNNIGSTPRRSFLMSVLMVILTIVSQKYSLVNGENWDDDAYESLNYDDANNAFDAVSLMPVSCINYNNGHMIKFQLFDNESSYKCHVNNMGTFVVSVAHYMRAYFNYQALTQGRNFALPSDVGYLNCVMLQATAYANTRLYAKIGCKNKETFTSTSLQLHLYKDKQCTYPYIDGNTDQFHSKQGYDVNGYLLSTKVNFRPPFYSCQSCKPEQISNSFNKKNYWYDDDYINSQKQNNNNKNNNDDGGDDDEEGDDAGDDYDDDVYNYTAVDDAYFAANDDNVQHDDFYSYKDDDAAGGGGGNDDGGYYNYANDDGGGDDAGDDYGGNNDDAGDDYGGNDDAGGDDAGDDYGGNNDDGGYYAYDDDANNRQLKALPFHMYASESDLKSYENEFWNDVEKNRRLADIGNWNMCTRVYKYGMWCDEECRALDTFRVNQWSHSDIFLLIIMCGFMSAMMLLIFAKRVKAYEKANVYGDEYDTNYPGLPPMAMLLLFILVMTIILFLANLKFVNETLVFSVVVCILLFIYMLKLTLFESRGPHLLPPAHRGVSMKNMNSQLFHT